jgi:hypothetical protein
LVGSVGAERQCRTQTVRTKAPARALIWRDWRHVERPVDVDGEIIYDVGEDIAKKMGELSRTEAIRNQVQQAHLDRNVVCNAIDDKIKKSIAALDDTPQDHAGSTLKAPR